MVEVLLLEDEEFTRDFLRQLLNEVPGITHVFDTGSGKEAIAWAETHNPHLILLDIELDKDGPNGIDVAKSIYGFHKDAYIVFVTGYSKYAVDSFEVHPYGYVLKPIVVSKFKLLITEIVQKVQYNHKSNSEIFTVRIKDELVHLNKKDIIFIEALNHTSIIHTQSAIWESRISLDQIEMMLGEGFLRVHRSFVVNLSKVKKTRVTLDRSYEIDFYEYPQKALMSRYNYPNYRKHFR
jgi:two-component system LytT family response regulator